MLYTVAEIADLTNLSKVSIYNKLKLKEMQEYISKKQGITYIDELGLNLIKDSLKVNTEGLNTFNYKDQDKSINDDISIDIDDLNLKTDYINYLKVENERLWQELNDKNLQIENLQQIVQNGQVLLKDKQQENILELEAHFKDIDSKLLEVKNKMQDKKDLEQKSFLSRLFKK